MEMGTQLVSSKKIESHAFADSRVCLGSTSDTCHWWLWRRDRCRARMVGAHLLLGKVKS